MPACHATYKCGITFDGWSTKPGFESYFHPFASMLDNLTMTPVRAQRRGAHQRRRRACAPGPLLHRHAPRRATAVRRSRARTSRSTSGTAITSMPCCSASSCSARRSSAACATRAATSRTPRSTADGAIASVSTQEGETIAADLFVDCSGFAGLLIDKALHTPFVSFANNLFNDAAVAMPTPIDAAIPSQTVSTALKHGWAWKIPLTSRFGNGYVYSTQFCTAGRGGDGAAPAPGAARRRTCRPAT